MGSYVEGTDRAPAASARLGVEGKLRLVHGNDFEGGLRPKFASLADDSALVDAQLVQHDRGPEVDFTLEALGEDVAVIVPPLLCPVTSGAQLSTSFDTPKGLQLSLTACTERLLIS